jgi:hypothetical protein
VEVVIVGELRDASEASVLGFVRCRDESVLDGESLRELRWMWFTAGDRSERSEFGLEFARAVAWERAAQPRAEQRIVAVHVTEARGHLR